jgi:hypothetical protein
LDFSRFAVVQSVRQLQGREDKRADFDLQKWDSNYGKFPHIGSFFKRYNAA